MFPEYIKFYYTVSTKEEKAIYKQIYQNLKERKKEFDIKTPGSIQMKKIFALVRQVFYDTPSFFYMLPSKVECKRISTGFHIWSNIFYTDDEINLREKQVLALIEKFKSQYIHPAMSEYAKEVAIHEWLIQNVDYDYKIYKDNDKHDDEYIKNHPETYTLLGPLLRKKGVCQGIAGTFKLLCDCLQVKSFVVSGKSVWAGEASPGHAWNMVQLDGENYHVDVTWDIRTRKKDIGCCYDYLNLSDRLIRFDHTWSETIYPKCTALTYNFYRRHGLYVRKLEDIPVLLTREYAKGRKYIPFKYANQMPPNDQIRDKIRQWVNNSSYYGSYTYYISERCHNVYLRLGDG